MGCNGGSCINAWTNEVFWVYLLRDIIEDPVLQDFPSMILSMDYEAITGFPVSGSQVVLLIISFSSSEKNFRIESPCSL